MMTAIVWALTLVIGFTVAYFLAFHIRTLKWQIVLFLLHDPVLDVEHHPHDLVDPASSGATARQFRLLIGGVIDEPLEWLLYSDFSVVLAFVHLYTLFMVVPIFNTMMRIDKSLIEAARDGGASGPQILTNVILPLTKPGIMIGSIFVVTLVMGDFVTVRFMSGSQLANVGR
jgi:putative spermidine/putrescine transport system permease protein